MASPPRAAIPQTVGGGYLATLDGWRAVAIVMVLMNHDRIYSFAGFSDTWLHRYGGMGVDLFFALSGILICTRLLAEERLSGFISLRKFYIRRVFRIQPAAILYLATVTLLMLIGTLDHAFGGVYFALLLVRNYLPLHPSPTDWYTGHFWSLSVEEHFYLLLPGAIIFFKRYRLAFLLSLVFILRVWIGVVHRKPSLHFGLTPQFHTDVALTGILLAASMAILLAKPRVASWSERWLNPYPILLLACAACYGSTISFNPLVSFAKDCMLPLLIISTTLNPSAVISKVLELSPLRFLGRVSYSIYLWQSLFFVNSHPVPTPHSTILSTIQASWMRYPATAIIVLASFYLVEKPMVGIGHRLTKRKPGFDADSARS